jgi:hypothetical protein
LISHQCGSSQKIQKLVPTTFDPFDVEVIHSDVHEMILQHFGAKDLLQMSEVSPAWCDLVEGKIGAKAELRCNADE